MFGLWDKYVVPPLIGCACSAKPIMRQRQMVVPQAAGVVLELGCGSGTNFDFYDPGKVEQLHALEPSGGMIKRARRAMQGHVLEGRTQLHEAGGEAVPLGDASVDTAIITFVLCTIPDWEGTLSELRRVLKPNGRILFSEHGLAPDESVAKWQRRIEPVWKALAGGCHLTRNTHQMLEAGGFRVDEEHTMYMPSTPKIAGFVSWGKASAI